MENAQTFEVRSDTPGAGTYTVTIVAGKAVSCTCQDHVKRGRVCKHMERVNLRPAYCKARRRIVAATDFTKKQVDEECLKLRDYIVAHTRFAARVAPQEAMKAVIRASQKYPDVP